MLARKAKALFCCRTAYRYQRRELLTIVVYTYGNTRFKEVVQQILKYVDESIAWFIQIMKSLSYGLYCSTTLVFWVRPCWARTKLPELYIWHLKKRTKKRRQSEMPLVFKLPLNDFARWSAKTRRWNLNSLPPHTTARWQYFGNTVIRWWYTDFSPMPVRMVCAIFRFRGEKHRGHHRKCFWYYGVVFSSDIRFRAPSQRLTETLLGYIP